MVGSTLVKELTGKGHQVVKLVRFNAQGSDILWHPDKGEIDRSKLEGFDAVVHLAGDNIASERWTEAKKARIRESRIKGTRLLCDTLASLLQPPKRLVCASAIGFYGDRGSEVLTEDSASGEGFLADVCKEWEAATAPAEGKGIEVVRLRIGVVLTLKGGALKKMLPPFQMGAGGVLGSGKQYMSWIALDDLTGIIEHALTSRNLSGAVNAVSPHPVTNDEFTRALGTSLHRPTIFPVPSFAARLLLGEMADELLLSSALVQPRKLEQTGYRFKHPDIAKFLKELMSGQAA